MEKMKRGTEVFFLVAILLGFNLSVNAEEPTLKSVYLKNGSVTRCDCVWKGLGDFVWCNQGVNAVGYPAGDTDMKKTLEIPAKVARLVNKSRDSFEDGDWDTAISAATSAIYLDPENEVAYTNRAGAYTRKGLFKEAINDCNRAVNINPNYSLAYNNRGFALERSGHLPQAIQDYNLSCRMGNELGCKNLQRVNAP
jgi:tetratricopeptide (TPR) repeat protein